jgi:uncharacterized protein (UPF0147 family)
MKKAKERGIVDLLRKIVADETQPAHVRREAQIALENHERLKGEEQSRE